MKWKRLRLFKRLKQIKKRRVRQKSRELFMISLNQQDLLVGTLCTAATRKYLNPGILPYLIGRRDSWYLFDVNRTYLQSKIVLSYLLNAISLRSSLLVIHEKDPSKLFQFVNVRGIFYYDTKWLGGSLTNYRKVRRTPKFLNDNDFDFKLGKIKFLPGLVFIADIHRSTWALLECSNLALPTTGLVNGFATLFRLLTYPIMGNTETTNLFFYFALLRSTVLKGKKKECLRSTGLV